MLIKILDKIIEMGYKLDQAEKIIRSGQVKVNDMIVFIPSQKIKTMDKVIIHKSKEWVSRGALKLLKAIEIFHLNLQNKVILDIGSSTGGFSQVALKFGAKKVNALDVGTNQLDYKIRTNPKVDVFEKTNLKTIHPNMFFPKIDIIFSDVAFISLKAVFKVCKHLGDHNLLIMALIKPQFEANSNEVQKGGFVSEKIHQKIIEKVINYAKNNDFVLKCIDKSPILGEKSKNIEYISLFERSKNE